MFFYFCFITDRTTIHKKRVAKALLWVLRCFSPGFIAIEPAIRAELVVEEQESQERREGDLDPDNPADPYRIREVKIYLFI